MKNIFIYSVVTVALLFTSCEDYLDTNSPSSFTQDYIFSSEADAAKAVYGIYALFNQDAYTSRLSSNFMGNTDIEAGGVSGSPDNARRDVWSFEATASNSDVRVVWNNAYNAINRANEAIEGIENSALYQQGNPTMNQLLGEALTLRAYWYYYLVNLWGDVPFKTTPTKAGDEFYLPRTDRNEILTQLIQDLIEIEPKMMWADQLDFGIERINREFVMGMIARLSLTRGGYALYPDMSVKRSDDYLEYYQIANTYTKKLVNTKPHSLNPDFGEVFRNEVEYISPENSDVLFEVAFHPGFGDVAWNNGVRVDAGTHPYGSGSNYISLPVSYFYSFDTLDTRQGVTCSLVYYDKNLLQQPVDVTSIAPGKWNRLWLQTPPGAASAKGTGVNWPVMRYSDVLLMLAETENEISGGPTGEAKEALRQVRQRAFPQSAWPAKVDEYISAVSGKEAFFNAIVDERAWEFGGEGLRKYDLIRWGLYGEKVAETRRTLIQMGLDAYNNAGEYAKYPDYLYYKRNADGTITYLNKFRRPAVVPPVVDSPNKGDNPDGYYSTTWLRGLINTTTMGPADYILRNWRGYQDDSGMSPVRYILPIPSETVTGSLGVLKNDGYGF
ncbi:RagB/SusD family nutrient uptake outer membrane protein [Pontibacter sp. 172403-2]|uniref:RagB/SusD family nutrient uptake outer membrane protein n=1 Tax=Pontibacter rufus TaxID=2791028 RepID=UPI0018AFC5CE|nr:RagB/SusD family nutrient uptake outer membrane protein [Pontibacter sp. 172403-2]MBF9255059.1 RagB/SusD family nutrient uptake outer membrane protein [Pontibacter sp. 172403-2]